MALSDLLFDFLDLSLSLLDQQLFMEKLTGKD